MAKRRSQSRQSLSLVGAIVVIILIVYNLILGGGGNSSATPTVPPLVTQSNTQVSPQVPATTESTVGNEWLKIYFTNPNPPDQVGHGIDNDVVAEAAKAQKTIDNK